MANGMHYTFMSDPCPESVVAAPTATGQVLTANATMCWQALTLGSVAGSFGTPQTLTAALTGLTIVGPGTPDYNIADVTNSSPYGFVGAEEARTVLNVIKNLQTRLAEVEAKLVALDICSTA